MATRDYERPVPRILQKDRSTPARPEGISWAGIVFLLFIVTAVAFVFYSVYSMSPPSAPKNAPATERTVVNPPNTSTPR